MNLRKILGGIGDVAKFALPAAAFIPGVNLGVGALAGLGAVAGGVGRLNDQDANGRLKAITARNIVPGAAMGAAGGAAGGVLAGGSSNQGRALQGLLRGGGGAVDWLTDKDQGAARTALLSSLASGGAGVMAGRQTGQMEDEALAYGRGRDAVSDARKQQIFDLLMQRFGARGGAA